MSDTEYKDLVFAEYDRQMETRLLPSELLRPTPANIKDLVVKFCERGSEPSTGDEQILRSFVGERADVAAYRNAFQNGKADPFRPVVTVLGNRLVKTNVKYINLLALLIGFPLRPYHPNLQPPSHSQNGTIDTRPVHLIQKPTGMQVETQEQITRKSYLKFLWIFAAIIGIGAGWYLISKKSTRQYTGREGCMIWNYDHYEPIECNDRSITAPHFQIKLEQVENFRRINKPDTLTYNSVNKAWYSNYKGKVEFYTDSGANPLDTNYRVLLMTKHAYEKYVLHITN